MVLQYYIDSDFIINVNDYMLPKPRKKLDEIQQNKAETLKELPIILG